MKKLQIVTITAACLTLTLSCAAPLHSYHAPSTMPSLVLIDDQILDFDEKLPDQAGLIELHLRDGRKISGKLFSFDQERIEMSPGFTYKTANGTTEKVDKRLGFDKDEILMLKIW